MKLKINNDGTIKAVYNDALRGLGPMEVNRASNVEFNQKSQQWEAKDNNGTIIAEGPKRNEVIKQEIAVIEASL